MPLYDWIYSDLHSLNLDWIISRIKDIEGAKAASEAAAGNAAASAQLAQDAVANLAGLIEKTSQPIWYPETYITVNNLMDLSVSDTYHMFDEYVSKGIITRTRVGYASSSAPGADASDDLARPIYMYSFRNPVASVTGYVTSGYNRPILLTSAMHGNEKLGTVVMLTLLKAYEDGDSPQIRNLFDNFGVDMIPILNPYGYDQAIGTTMATVENNVGRLNARNVDINRNGVTAWESNTDTYKGNGPLSECESKIIHDLAVTNGTNYSFWIDIHTDRYNASDHNYFGTVSNGGTLIRSIFSSVMSRLNERMFNYYGYNVPLELNGSSITGRINRTPMHVIDRCYMLDSYSLAALYEGPRYNNGEIYPVKTQKFTSDILINFILNSAAFLQEYKTIYNSLQRDYKNTKTMLHDVLPTSKSAYKYGYATGGVITDSNKIVYTENEINIDPGTFYEVIPTNSDLHYQIDMEYNGTFQTITWRSGRYKFFTGENNKMRISIAANDPNGDVVLNLPDLGHDYDLLVINTGEFTENIANDLSSSYGTVLYAVTEKTGRIETCAIRVATTSAVSAGDKLVEGLPLAMANYKGLNSARFYDDVNSVFHDVIINNVNGDTESYMEATDTIPSGAHMRGTFSYFVSE